MSTTHRNGNGHGNGYNGNGNGHGADYSRRKDRGDSGPSPWTKDNLPPQNIEAEQGVLGGILWDNEVLHDVAMILNVEDFYRDTHQIIFGAIRELYEQGKAIDYITLGDELTRKSQLEKIGGLDTLRQLYDSVPHGANAKYHAQIIHQKAVARRLIESANQIIHEGFSDNFSSDELLEAAERRIFAIAEEQTAGETKDLKDIIVEAMDRIQARSEDRHAVTGIPTGFYDLDEMTGGFDANQLIIIAARPSMGKTAFALNICEQVAVERQKSVLFVSLEMGANELVERLLCSRSRVDLHKLRTGKNLGHHDMIQLGRGYNELRAAPFFIDDTPARNMLQITANARRLKMRNDIGMIMVDYIQLVDAEDGRDSRQEQIAKISRRMKTLARELKVPVVALSQLNRGVENREDRRPRMADLRESGAIEQDADMVLLLHRPEYYDPNDQPGVAELIVAKNRNGATGSVKMSFMRALTRFENLAQINEPLDAGGAF